PHLAALRPACSTAAGQARSRGRRPPIAASPSGDTARTSPSRGRDSCPSGPGPRRSRRATGPGAAHPQPSERSLARGLAPCTEAYRPVKDPAEPVCKMPYASGVDLPDGYVAFVKASCPTCQLVVPALLRLREVGVPLTVYSQDDPRFPE